MYQYHKENPQGFKNIKDLFKDAGISWKDFIENMLALQEQGHIEIKKVDDLKHPEQRGVYARIKEEGIQFLEN